MASVRPLLLRLILCIIAQPTMFLRQMGLTARSLKIMCYLSKDTSETKSPWESNALFEQKKYTPVSLSFLLHKQIWTLPGRDSSFCMLTLVQLLSWSGVTTWPNNPVCPDIEHYPWPICSRRLSGRSGKLSYVEQSTSAYITHLCLHDKVFSQPCLCYRWYKQHIN